LPVLRRLIEMPGCELVHTFFYNTLRQGQDPIWKSLQEFGWSGIMSKGWQVATSKVRIQIAHKIIHAESWARSSYELAVLKSLPHSVVQNMNDRASLVQLADLKIDLLVVAICKNILKSEVLEIPQFGAINIHPSLLPQYRGPSPAFWALYHRENESGVTLHRMTTKIDQGDIVGQHRFSIKRGWGEDDIVRKGMELAAEHLAAAIETVKKQQRIEISIEQAEKASYFSYPTASQRRELRQIRRGR
jgi:methionyl-tRNA formyltransferase